jgi:hypothetical protein
MASVVPLRRKVRAAAGRWAESGGPLRDAPGLRAIRNASPTKSGRRIAEKTANLLENPGNRPFQGGRSKTTSGGVSGGSATVTLSLDIALPGRTMDPLRLALGLDQSMPIIICQSGYSKQKNWLWRCLVRHSGQLLSESKSLEKYGLDNRRPQRVTLPSWMQSVFDQKVSA